jgi:hypothetical protein
VGRELREKTVGDDHTRLCRLCAPHDTDSALYPLIDQLERAAGFLTDQGDTYTLDDPHPPLAIPDDRPDVARWYAEVSARPSASA